jgi:hypothetical protein
MKPAWTLILFLGAIVLLSTVLPVSAEVYQVNQSLLEVTLLAEKPTIMLGEPAYLSFLVKNQSKLDLQVLVGGDYRNALGRPDSFAVTITDENGRLVSQPDAGPALGGIVGPQKIPASGSYTFKLFLPDWAIFKKIGTYSIVAKRTLKISKYAAKDWDKDQSAGIQAQASTKIRIVPLNNDAMGTILATLGHTMLSARYDESEIATKRLMAIQDKRVIPYFVKAFATRDYSKKYAALGALAPFNDDAALDVLRQGMEAKGAEMGEEPLTPAVANSLAENIRTAAAQDLARSPHPGAIPFLLSKRTDPSEGVRITVLHALGKMKPKVALPILQEMVRDKNKRVRDEADRYIKLLTQNLVPQRFSATIGGFLGSSFRLELRNGTLVYTKFDPGHQNPKETFLTTTAAQWGEFRRALDALHLWQWRSEYPNGRTKDGTLWSLDIVYEDQALKTQGSNNYPETAGQNPSASEPTYVFKRYLAAVKKLAGHQRFE